MSYILCEIFRTLDWSLSKNKSHMTLSRLRCLTYAYLHALYARFLLLPFYLFGLRKNKSSAYFWKVINLPSFKLMLLLFWTLDGSFKLVVSSADCKKLNCCLTDVWALIENTTKKKIKRTFKFFLTNYFICIYISKWKKRFKYWWFGLLVSSVILGTKLSSSSGCL